MIARTKSLLALFLIVPALVAAGCGGDGDDAAGTASTGATSAPAPAPAGGSTETTMAPDGTPTTRSDAAPAPSGKRGENQPGGAGDEVPNSTQALVTGKGGKVTPPTVAVPPFIAITVELRSADGRAYELRGGGKRLRTSGSKPATASYAGLRTGRKLVLRGPQGSVTITANADPGP